MNSKLAGIKALVLDVDGVLTDGRILVGPDSKNSRSYHVRDGIGLVMLRKAGLRCALLTSAPSSPSIVGRASQLAVDHVLANVKDKSDEFAKLLDEWQLNAQQAAYMGDDLIDIGPIRSAGIGAAPADAHPAVKQAADVVTKAAGGCGAVRELCEMIMEIQQPKILADAKKCGLQL